MSDVESNTGSRRSSNCSDRSCKSYYRLTINLKEAHDLIAMDKCGTSDPYVKVKLDRQTAYRSKTIKKSLDPVWNETCELTLDHLGQKVGLSVYDYDRGSLSDDFLGQVDINILNLELEKTVHHKLELVAKSPSANKDLYRGHVIITTHLQQFTGAEAKQILKPDFMKRLAFTNQQWRYMLEVVVIHIRNLHVPVFAHSPSSSTASLNETTFYLRISCGSDSYRSKSIRFQNDAYINRIPLITNVCEHFSFVIKDNPVSDLCLSLSDGNIVIGRAEVNLSDLAIEQTHTISERLSDNCGQVLMSITLTGARPDIIAAMGHLPPPTWEPHGEPIISSEFLRAEEATWLKELGEIFSLANSTNLPSGATGVLVLKIIQASNVIVADVGGKSDPFCVIEIVNVRLRTHTEHKTIHPRWNRTYIIPVDDIHSLLTITVFDDDRDGKPEFLGKMIVPLLQIHRMNGERNWYALRSSRLTESSTDRGSIEIEGYLYYNKPRAIVRAFDPKEQSYFAKEEKISIKMLQHDIARVKKLIDKYYQVQSFVTDLMAWKNPFNTTLAILAVTIICLCFDPWMIPFSFATIFMVTYFLSSSDNFNDLEEDPDAKNDTEDNKFSLTDKLNKLQDICLTFHKSMDNVTSLYERLKNIVLWRSPWVSATLLAGFLVLSLIWFIFPLRLLMMAIGIYELVKKKVRPSAGFEAYDLISRAYTDGEMIKFREPIKR